MKFSLGKNVVLNDDGVGVGEVELSTPYQEFGDEAPFYFGEWIALAGLDVYPEFRRKGYAKKIMNDLISWATSSGKKGILLRPEATSIGGLSGEGLEDFYRSFGFTYCETSSELMEKKLYKPMAFNLFAALKRMGFHKEAADLKELIPDSIKEDPLTAAFAFGGLNIAPFVESGDESEIDPDHVQAVLNRAGLYGFGGECAEAAIAINDVLFNEEGVLVAAVNKWIFENEGRAVGHVAVQWGDGYWDAEGKKDWEEIESWGMVDELDSDFDLGDNPEENAYSVEKITLSREEALQMFGGCNLKKLTRELERADKEIENEKNK